MAWQDQQNQPASFAFSGINNTADPASLKPGECVAADNGYFTNNGGFTRRSGRISRYTGTPESIWSDGHITLFVENGELKRLRADYTAETLLPVGTGKMVYAGMPGYTIFSNATIIGQVVNGIASLATVPASTRMVEGEEVETFLEPLPPCQLLTNWNGTLCMAVQEGDETWIYLTPAYDWSGIDGREDYFRYHGAPTLLEAVNDGLYVGAGEEVHFLTGSGLKWETKRVLEVAAVKGASTILDGGSLGLTENGASINITGKVALFATDRIYLGLNGGQLIDLSHGRVALPTGKTGTAYVETRNGVHLAGVLINSEQTSINQYQPQPIEVNQF